MMKFGFPVYTASDIRVSIERAHRLGFDYIEFDLNPPRPQSISSNELKALEKLKEDYNLEVGFHGPIFGIDMAHLSEKISEASLGVVMDAARFSERFKPLYFNLHLGSYSNPYLLKSDNIKRGIYKRALDNLQKIIRSTSMQITIENEGSNPIFRTPQEFVMLENLNVNFCLDVGHAAKARFLLEKSGIHVDWEMKDWLRSFKDKILAAHLHDCIVKDNQIFDHNAVGSGCIDFVGIFEGLKKTKCKYALIETAEAAEGKAGERKIKENLEFCRNGLE